MGRIRLDNNVFLPMPVGLLGALVKGKANFMAVGWMIRVNGKPPMIAVSVNKSHLTATGVEETGTFSICIPNVGMEKVTDYCGIVSGRAADKSALFALFYGKTGTAPMIAECPLNMELKLAQTMDLPSHLVYIGEIVSVYGEEACLANGKPDYRKIDPLLLTMPDNRYWRLGEQVGNAWKDGLLQGCESVR